MWLPVVTIDAIVRRLTPGKWGAFDEMVLEWDVRAFTEKQVYTKVVMALVWNGLNKCSFGVYIVYYIHSISSVLYIFLKKQDLPIITFKSHKI